MSYLAEVEVCLFSLNIPVRQYFDNVGWVTREASEVDCKHPALGVHLTLIRRQHSFTPS